MTGWKTCLRVELEVDAVQVDQVETRIEALGVTSWIVLSAHSGRSSDGRWSRAGQVTASGRRMLVVFTIPPALADTIRDALRDEMVRLNGEIIAYPVTTP